jgi:hypothetical protein
MKINQVQYSTRGKKMEEKLMEIFRLCMEIGRYIPKFPKVEYRYDTYEEELEVSVYDTLDEFNEKRPAYHEFIYPFELEDEVKVWQCAGVLEQTLKVKREAM